MGVITDFGNAVVSLVKLGPTVNRQQRQEIRDAVGELADELERALQLTEGYLAGAKNIREATELAQYLRNAQTALLGSFNEYKVCAGLYALHDRFDRLFDPARYAIAVGSGRQIQDLINTLAFGERMIIDDLDESMKRLQDVADDVDRAAPGEDEEAARKVVLTTLTLEIEKLRGHRRMIKTTMREVFKNM